MQITKLLLAAGVGLLLGAGCISRVPPPDAQELKEFPPVTEYPGKPPVTGVRYWRTPLKPLPLRGCYVSVTTRNEQGRRELELWQNVWGDGGAKERGITVHRAAKLSRMRVAETVCEGTVITDVMEPDRPGQPAPGRGFTRPFMLQDAEYGYVLMACVCPDYKPGSVPLLPAILTSPNGLAGSFHYLGKITGEPAAEAAKRKIWSDGGSLLRLPDGRWRMYLNGYGQVLAAAESATLTGPWSFLRTPQGGIRELLAEFPKAPNRGGCFPTVLQVAGNNWHLWITDTWPPQSIWHFVSPDGLAWQPYGDQPEITRAAVNGHGIKCLRAYVDPDTREIVGLLSVWGTDSKGEKGWILHETRMPSAAAPP